MPEGPWTVDDARAPGGARPVRDVLDGLSKAAKARVYAVLSLLSEHGHRPRMPHSRALGEGLHELRARHQEGPFRIIDCFRPGRRVVLLHAFVKRTARIPAREMAVATARRRALEAMER